MGYKVEGGGCKHFKVYGSKIVYISSSPSDYRALFKIKRDLRNAGIIIL